MEVKTISLATLAAILGLPETTEEAALTAELKKRATQTQPAALSADLATALANLINPLTAKLTALETKLLDTEKASAELKRTELVTLFAGQGKVPLKKDSKAYTADELKALPVDTLELLLANTAGTVPLSARNAAHGTETRKTHRVKVGDKEVVDMGAIFDEEAVKSGLTANPTN